MRTQIFAAAALLASSAAATNTWTRIDTSPADSFRFLRARQGGESFKPDQTNGSGETCEDAFGAGYIQCGTTGKVCFNPNIGQSCCDGCMSPLTITYREREYQLTCSTQIPAQAVLAASLMATAAQMYVFS